MSPIDGELGPGEQVIKTQRLDVPPGDLYLTSHRLLFRRLWRIGAQNITLPLSQIHGLRIGMGFLYVTADKEYSFLVRYQARSWLTEIQRVQQQPSAPPPHARFDEGLTQPRPPQYAPQTSAHHPVQHCPTCGRPADFIQRYQRYHCYHCQQYLDT
jgi:hypothetical protein